MTFFGGKPGVSHFSADVAYRLENESYGDANARRKAERAILKAAGFAVVRFQFNDGDEIAKAKAEAKSQAVAQDWTAKTGVVLAVTEGCFL